MRRDWAPSSATPSWVGGVGTHRGARAGPFQPHPSPLPLASSLPPLWSGRTAHTVFRFPEPFLSTRWRHRQMSNIPGMFWGSFASLCEGRKRTPRRVLNSFHFELLRGRVQGNLLPYHVVTSWRPQSGSCMQTRVSQLGRLRNLASQSFIRRAV